MLFLPVVDKFNPVFLDSSGRERLQYHDLRLARLLHDVGHLLHRWSTAFEEANTQAHSYACSEGSGCQAKAT